MTSVDELDTGDLIRHQGEEYMIACVHDQWVHTCGPHKQLHASNCKLVRKATDDERDAQLHAMAASSSNGHRSACARARLAIDDPGN